MSSGSSRARISFLVLGALLTITCVDVFIQSRQCVGVKAGIETRSQSVSTKMGTSSHSTFIDIVEYNVGGQTFRLDGGSRSLPIGEGKWISWGSSGEKVVVWYYSRMPKFASIGPCLYRF
jgi:hypothetical protein